MDFQTDNLIKWLGLPPGIEDVEFEVPAMRDPARPLKGVGTIGQEDGCQPNIVEETEEAVILDTHSCPRGE